MNCRFRDLDAWGFAVSGALGDGFRLAGTGRLSGQPFMGLGGVVGIGVVFYKVVKIEATEGRE
jgi:hypothetical protein